jgi:hypothetical protein
MQNIHVHRYDSPAYYTGWIMPEDRSWIVFIDQEGQATFWRRVEKSPSEGRVDHSYVNVEDSTLPS